MRISSVPVATQRFSNELPAPNRDLFAFVPPAPPAKKPPLRVLPVTIPVKIVPGAPPLPPPGAADRPMPRMAREALLSNLEILLPELKSLSTPAASYMRGTLANALSSTDDEITALYSLRDSLQKYNALNPLRIVEARASGTTASAVKNELQQLAGRVEQVGMAGEMLRMAVAHAGATPPLDQFAKHLDPLGQSPISSGFLTAARIKTLSERYQHMLNASKDNNSPAVVDAMEKAYLRETLGEVDAWLRATPQKPTVYGLREALDHLTRYQGSTANDRPSDQTKPLSPIDPTKGAPATSTASVPSSETTPTNDQEVCHEKPSGNKTTIFVDPLENDANAKARRAQAMEIIDKEINSLSASSLSESMNELHTAIPIPRATTWYGEGQLPRIAKFIYLGHHPALPLLAEVEVNKHPVTRRVNPNSWEKHKNLNVKPQLLDIINSEDQYRTSTLREYQLESVSFTTSLRYGESWGDKATNQELKLIDFVSPTSLMIDFKKLAVEIPANTHLNRSIGRDIIGPLEKLKRGDVIMDPSFVSTSLGGNPFLKELDPDDVFLKIITLPGVKGIYVDAYSGDKTVDPLSLITKGENEVILPPGTRFLVKEIDERCKNGEKKGPTIITLYALPSGRH